MIDSVFASRLGIFTALRIVPSSSTARTAVPLQERARRRAVQLSQAGITATLSSLCEEIRARDDRDRNRAVAPLKAAPDAELVDTTGLTPEAVRARIEQLLRQRGL